MFSAGRSTGVSGGAEISTSEISRRENADMNTHLNVFHSFGSAVEEDLKRGENNLTRALAITLRELFRAGKLSSYLSGLLPGHEKVRDSVKAFEQGDPSLVEWSLLRWPRRESPTDRTILIGLSEGDWICGSRESGGESLPDLCIRFGTELLLVVESKLPGHALDVRQVARQLHFMGRTSQWENSRDFRDLLGPGDYSGDASAWTQRLGELVQEQPWSAVTRLLEKEMSGLRSGSCAHFMVGQCLDYYAGGAVGHFMGLGGALDFIDAAVEAKATDAAKKTFEIARAQVREVLLLLAREVHQQFERLEATNLLLEGVPKSNQSWRLSKVAQINRGNPCDVSIRLKSLKTGVIEWTPTLWVDLAAEEGSRIGLSLYAPARGYNQLTGLVEGKGRESVVDEEKRKEWEKRCAAACDLQRSWSSKLVEVLNRVPNDPDGAVVDIRRVHTKSSNPGWVGQEEGPSSGLLLAEKAVTKYLVWERSPDPEDDPLWFFPEAPEPGVLSSEQVMSYVNGLSKPSVSIYLPLDALILETRQPSAQVQLIVERLATMVTWLEEPG